MRAALPRFAALTALVAICLAAPAGLDPHAAKPPVAKKVPHPTTLHGDTRPDDYFWLRDKKNPEVIAYLETENAYTSAVMRPTEALQETLYNEMLGRLKQTDLSVPYRLGDYRYYGRTEEGKQYTLYCRKRIEPEGDEEVILDLNELADGKKFLGLGFFKVSDDGGKLAYATDVTGFREFTLYVKDLLTGKVLPDRVARVGGVEWAADGKTLFYVTEDAAKRPFRLYRHHLGGTEDRLAYEEKDELYRLTLTRSRDRSYLFATSLSSTTSEVRAIPSAAPSAAPRLLLPRQSGHRYAAEHRGDRFYFVTNRDARDFSLVTAPVAEPDKWTELVPHRPGRLLEQLHLFSGHAVLLERGGGLQHVRVLDLASGKAKSVAFPEPVYMVQPAENPESGATRFRYNYQSLVTPESVVELDLRSLKTSVLKRKEVRGGYDPARYASERVLATATDGTKVPVSLVYRKDQRRPEGNPLLLYGYGAYGLSVPVTFDANRLSLLDRGVIYAVAHVRGGREMGETWHDQGKMLYKRNTFTDFIAAADHLVAEKYTTPDRLAVMGGSAGGLLIGATLNLRPDLCRAAVLMVPFVDVVNTMLDESLPLTVGEFLEWGNPRVKNEYDYIKSYCPYTNLAPRAYPSILVRTSLNDSQVMYWEPAKYVARLRTLKTDKHPLLLRVNMAAGHGGSSGRYDALHETAFTYAFLLAELGVTE